MQENEFLRWIALHAADPALPPGARWPATASRVEVGIGDDMAVLRGRSQDPVVLLKTDQCLDQVHFDLREHSAAQVGRKAVNRCLSDCAAMGCVPTALMVAVALPREGPGSGEGFAKELFIACREAAGAFDCPLVGGDTAIWDQRLAITISAMGELAEGASRYIRRSGAKAGDTLFVSGALGGSILGRHLDFEPRIGLARRLVAALGAGLHAMMDLSDGLAQDLPRLCAASGVGAEVHAGRLPIHADAERLAEKDSMPAGLHALADGEDYELLFAVETEEIPKLIDLSQNGGVPLTAIGMVTEGSGLWLVDEGGRKHQWPRVGWQHQS
jgi:thiamine-monophosphate kinase